MVDLLLMIALAVVAIYSDRTEHSPDDAFKRHHERARLRRLRATPEEPINPDFQFDQPETPKKSGEAP